MAKRVLEISPMKGGALSASLSHENIGQDNYVEKTNWRRDKDQEIRREGWFIWEPIDGPANQDVFDATDTVIKMAEIVRPDGTREVIGASRTEIKRFNSTTGAWDVIGSGYSVSGKRWQVVSMNGYLAFNNTIDLPVTYYVGDELVTPMYELRERGIVSAGRMEQSNGFILFADIVEFQSGQLEPWMRGFSTYSRTPNGPISPNYSIQLSDNGTELQLDYDISDENQITLLTSPPNGFFFWISFLDYDPPVLPSIELLNGIVIPPAILNNIDNLVLIRWDAVTQTWYASNFVDGVVPADDPYGLVPEYLTNRFPWRIINGEFANPRKWAPIVSVNMTAASDTLVLPFVPHSWTQGTVRVGVINGGPGGGVLGGQTNYPNGIRIVSIAGNTITLEEQTDPNLVYPRNVSVTLFTDLSTLSASYDLQDDGSRIHGLMVLQNLIIVYRKTGIYVGRYTGISTDSNGNTTGPFNFTPRYRGYNIPLWGDCIANVKGEYHLYPAEGNRWFAFDGNTNPQVHAQTDLARKLFFDGIDAVTYEPWAIESPMTKEHWFFRNGKVFCYDTEFYTVSIIDAQIDAAVFALRPNTDDVRWFILGILNLISVYGMVEEYDPPLSFKTWLRRDQPAYPVIKSGLITAGDSYNEKTWTSFVPIMATLSPDITWTVELFACWNPSVTPVALLDQPEVFPTPENENLLACFYQALYFQFKITVNGAVNADARYAGSLMEIDRVDAGRVNTRVDQ